MLDLSKKLSALGRIYEIYDSFAGTLNPACEKGCSSCCTCNVTITTLEGYRMIEWFVRTKSLERLSNFECLPGRRFHPRISINELAELCAEGKEPPEEEIDPNWGKCLLLENELCSIYPERPFGCRCMGSRLRCRGGDPADMDPFSVSVSTVIQQTIEHVDSDGYSGNFVDVLQLLLSESARKEYKEGLLTVSGTPLIPNRPMTKLFVPPEHRTRIQPILRALWAIGEENEKMRS